MTGRSGMADGAFLERLAAWVADPGRPPAEALENARRGMADLVGVTLAARDGEIAEVLRRAELAGAPDGPASVIGLGTGTTAATAAFCNGAIGHALDFDDSHSDLGGHPSVVIVPAALAVAETEGASGADLLEAVAVGVEVAAALGRGLNPAHYDSGWHPTATLGAFGATAAAARLLGLDAERVTTAFALTVAFCSGVKASFGTMAKPLQVGRAARNGVEAARLAQAGATAPAAAFEGKQGFLAVIQRTDAVPELRLPGQDGAPWSLAMPGIIIKRHPCCGSTHAAVDAALELRRDWAPGRITSVRIGLHPKRLGHVNRPHPVTGIDAKFSVQYVVARALLDGAVTFEHFEEAAIADPRIAEVLAVTEAYELDAPDDSVQDRYVAELAVEAEGGSRSLRLPRAIGREPGSPLPWEAVHEKFDHCTASLPGAVRDGLWERLMAVEAGAAAELGAALRLGTAPAG